MIRRLLSLLTILCLLCACDPLAPVITPTAQVIIVTPEDTATPVATATTPPTQTPLPSPTPQDTATPTPLPCLQDGGQIIAYDDFRSTIANENLNYRVYIPPCYVETNRRYPYVILLPGLQSNETQWGDLGIQQALDQGIRLGAIAPMVVVMPEYGAFGTDDRYPPQPSYEDVMLEELLPAIERDFCTWNDRDHRAIGGISRGGFWAYSIALRHPDVFGIVGGHSAAFYTSGVPAASNPLELALNAPFLANANLRMYIDNGAEDPAGTNLELFSNRLSSRGIAHTYVISPVGGHDDAYWSGHLQDYLTFYARDWSRSVDDLPSCSQPSRDMPTPFTHLVYAQHLLSDPAVPEVDRRLLNANRGAYLLGSVVADAHALAGLKRDDTHFYSFDKPMEDHPWRVMMMRYPSLLAAETDDWRAFLAGYVMHLSMDEIWSLDMTGPEFAGREWATQRQRFLMLHILLITLDERDLARLDAGLNEYLRDVPIHHWLPFLSDDVLRQWETLIYRQIAPGGESETLSVYGVRVGKTPEELRAILDSPEQVERDLWANVTREKTAEVEVLMLDHARAQMIAYLRETEQG